MLKQLLSIWDPKPSHLQEVVDKIKATVQSLTHDLRPGAHSFQVLLLTWSFGTRALRLNSS